MLMVAVLGIVLFARAYNIYQTATRAVREGVREAVLPTAVAASPSDALSYLGADGACPAAPTNSPSTAIFTQYIAPALQASSLNPAEVVNYRECLTYLDPASTSSTTANPADPDSGCGVQVSFGYPVKMNIPFLAQNQTEFDVGVDVQMRLEDQTTSGGTTVCAAGG